MAKATERTVIRRPKHLMKALRWSVNGLKAAWINEISFRTEAIVCLICAPFGVWLGQTAIERIVLVSSLLLVLAIELLNSAIETVIERFNPEQHILAGRAKDMGSAAVLVVLLNVVVCWGMILIPRIV